MPKKMFPRDLWRLPGGLWAKMPYLEPNWGPLWEARATFWGPLGTTGGPLDTKVEPKGAKRGAKGTNNELKGIPGVTFGIPKAMHFHLFL